MSKPTTYNLEVPSLGMDLTNVSTCSPEDMYKNTRNHNPKITEVPTNSEININCAIVTRLPAFGVNCNYVQQRGISQTLLSEGNRTQKRAYWKAPLT